MRKKTIEEEYVMLEDQREHVLLRPQTYIGHNVMRTVTEIVPDDKGIMSSRVLTYNPGFLKLFDEVFTNSIDEHIRPGSLLDKVEVNIDRDGGIITVKDNGGIPVVIHKRHGIYVPEMIFGRLMSGSNYDDTDMRTGGGMNGLGAKLANIFSKEFVVETCDGSKMFTQKWSENMLVTGGPEIKRGMKKNRGTVVTYRPELSRFGMNSIDDDMYTLLYRRCLFAAACNPGLKVFFQGEILDFGDWDRFVGLYSTSKVLLETGAWKIGVTPSEEHSHESFVNSVHTPEGGTHVEYVVSHTVDILKEYVLKKHKMSIRPVDIRKHLNIIVSVTVTNPLFQSQTKEKLITSVKDMEDVIVRSPQFKKSILSSCFTEIMDKWAQRETVVSEDREKKALNRDVSKNKVEKLIDAKGKNRVVCTLGIFEGDSATSAFRKYRDPMTQGAYALKGKLMNVSDVTAKKMSTDKDVMGLMSAIGLRIGEKAVPGKLRYGKILFYVDADTDGDSIAALMLNLFYRNWPELFVHGIIYKIQTPILVAEPEKKGKEKLFFYSVREYDEWVKMNKKGYAIKYKKGLASLVDEEYRKIIREPVKMKILPDDNSLVNLDIWFGKDTSKRKELLIV
jgi:DNA topoisomerase-2